MSKDKADSPEKREVKELERAIKALQATGHNPIEFAPIIRFVAPIVARIAARYAMRLLARKLNRRIGDKIKNETVIKVADRIAEIAVKRTVGPKKKN